MGHSVYLLCTNLFVLGIRSFIIKPVAAIVANRVAAWSKNAVADQQRIRQHIVAQASQTRIGKECAFGSVKSHVDFKQAVPVADYEQQKHYFDAIANGDKDVTWPGKPVYLAKTSGTTSGTKYIPITKQSIGNHFFTAQTATLLYMYKNGLSEVMDGKMIFLSGSPELEQKNGISVGRLSGIVNHQVPAYLKGNQLPSWETNCIDDWETKLDHIVNETIAQDMSLISGIPPWVQMYFDKLQERTGKPIKDIFPNFKLFVTGGVNYTPYKHKLEQSIGKGIDTLETYPASEGFIAFQDNGLGNGLLLNTNSGIFFEFVPADEIFNDNPTRLQLHEVELGVNYALIISSNAGLWGYNIGDTVKFVSKEPYRIIVTGRIKHFISAFGEHVIGEEVDAAMQKACAKFGAEVTEFTVAPMISPSDGLPYHEWLVEFDTQPTDLNEMARYLDEQMRTLNTYYNDLITGSVLRPLKITPLIKNSFIDHMRSQGKLGGQNKVPRLANDRKIADALMAHKLHHN